ncbi:dTDP-4-dehydrorhamnose 3,5-epimerase family protein [Tsukamurella paurometabola]|uniref:dTDP-4-dehydrorhamnose 3,5-epimerase n=1 Tax=Tsukamurella paurometabola TaxID=2061 RepID=A0A3P8MDL9_TSUPA|nr:dTDP-4-dehydrorhamnose 3,5-epimerase [Tsukamurella paurometabola]UEA81966.1 dTDP-4-dehydrorhamnose 3,5-epimerase [Tsukamurella paurometabola]VDR38993.1 dTDP-4-dehydrorhamnose 3,5-epimerase [Tsukamurella paurometabola]
MNVVPLPIAGAFVLDPVVRPDARGEFFELFKGSAFREATGHELVVAQTNVSVNRMGAVRGIHYADVPPGQAKLVACLHGAVLDVIVDLRVGSPTFGAVETVRLDDATRRTVYLAEGLGHGFCALTEGAVVAYHVSSEYNPSAEHGVDPLDPELAIAWPDAAPPILSEKDTAAPSLAEALAAGALPVWQAP